MKLKKTVMLITGLLLLGGVVRSSAQGTRAMEFLTVGTGARAAALGNAYVSLADDAEGLFWNPAGAAQAGAPQILASYNRWVLDMMIGNAAVLVPTRIGNVGVLVSYFSSGDIPRVENFLTVGYYQASDVMAGVAYSRSIWPGLSVGLLGKYISEKIEEVSASALAADVGVLFRLNRTVLTKETAFHFGASLQNIGSGVTFLEETESLPARIQFGCSASAVGITVTAAGFYEMEGLFDFAGGVEYNWNRTVYLRTGYHSEYAGRFGFGLRLASVRFDYAFAPVQELGNSNRFTLILEF